MDYIPQHWLGTALEERLLEVWSKRRYRLRMIAEGRWDYLHSGTYGACRSVYYRTHE